MTTDAPHTTDRSRRRGAVRAARPGDRYLCYHDPSRGWAGLGHWTTNLKCLAIEAAQLGRVPVLPPLTLSPRHNFGVDRDWRWEAFFDLAGARLVHMLTGRSRPVTFAALPPARHAAPLTVALGAPVPRAARHAAVVVRTVEGYYPRVVPRSVLPAWTRLAMPPSARVAELARPAIDALRSRPRGYVAVHIRRGDGRPRDARWREATTPERVRAALHAAGVTPRTPVFCLGDTDEPDYWAALGRHCAMVRHLDFPHLARLVERSETGPDNYLLFAAEVQIMRHARLRIGTAWGPERPPADRLLMPPPPRGLRRTWHQLRMHLPHGPQVERAAAPCTPPP